MFFPATNVFRLTSGLSQGFFHSSGRGELRQSSHCEERASPGGGFTHHRIQWDLVYLNPGNLRIPDTSMPT